MSDEPPIDDDILSLIEHFRGRSAAPARDPVERRTERRVADRRGLGLTARRRDDAERNRQRRTFLLSYLRRLPAETLWAWIDGVWLGCATDAQLDELMQAISESGMQAPAQESRTGRPRTEQFIPGEHPLVVRDDWHALTEEFKDFGRSRQQHHAPANRKRNGAPLSLAGRERCLASPLGQRVDHAGLFTEFFDAGPHPIATEMAARLLHYERLAYLTAFEANARAQAAQAPSVQKRKLWAAQATRAAARLKQFPAWETLHRELRTKPPATKGTQNRTPKRRPKPIRS